MVIRSFTPKPFPQQTIGTEDVAGTILHNFMVHIGYAPIFKLTDVASAGTADLGMLPVYNA